MSDLSQAIRDVIAERQRQMSVEDFDTSHDDMATRGQLASAAACYALTAVVHWAADAGIKTFWPWSSEWWKPRDVRRNLVRSGALILAEIDRLDRLQAKTKASLSGKRLPSLINGKSRQIRKPQA